MAAPETDIRLQDARTVGAFHVLWNSSNGIWDFNVEAGVRSTLDNRVVVLYEWEF